jgi:hypothetical protein
MGNPKPHFVTPMRPKPLNKILSLKTPVPQADPALGQGSMTAMVNTD